MRVKQQQQLVIIILLVVVVVLTQFDCGSSHGHGGGDDDAVMLRMFVDQLPSLRKVKGYTENRGARLTPGHITIGMYKTTWKFHRDLLPSVVYAYGTSLRTASVPGPLIEARSGVATFITWENHILDSTHMFRIDPTLEVARPAAGGIPTVVHLHGGLTEPQSDGHALSWFTAEFAEKGPTWTKPIYHYHNSRSPGNLWYHDHAMGLTRLNILAGLLGAYSIYDPEVEDPLGLPAVGSEFDHHLVIFDRQFTNDSQIFINSTGDNPHIHPEWQPEYFGDAIIVNGKAWPYLKVKRAKYRFRIINASNARFYRLALALSKGSRLPFTQIGSDCFYLEKPVRVTKILLAPSEIADVIVDFSNPLIKTDMEVLLTNTAAYPFPEGDPVNRHNGKVMKFIVESASVGIVALVPTPRMLVPVKRLRVEDAALTRYIVMFEFESDTGEPSRLQLNFLPFRAPTRETPKQGSTEVWHVINLTEDNHPFHMHLVAFQVVGTKAITNGTDAIEDCVRRLKDVHKCHVFEGTTTLRAAKPPPNEAGWKNVYKMAPATITTILVRFSQTDSQPFPFDATKEPGYVYHCHILDHEDNMMMRPYKILP